MESKTFLRVKGWDDNFENNRTRELKTLAWVPVPNKHDGDGYTALMDHPDGTAHLGAWLCILQIASKCGMRGTLLRDNGKPHDEHSISRLTRVPHDLLKSAIKRLCSDDVGWLEVVDGNTLTTIPQEGATIPHDGASSRVRAERKGKEEKRREIEDIIFDYFEGCTPRKRELLESWFSYKKEIRDSYNSTRGIKAFFTKLDKDCVNEDHLEETIQQSMASGWKGLFFDRSAEKYGAMKVSPQRTI